MPAESSRRAPTAGADTVSGLTHRQTLFWLGQELSGDDPVYNIAFVYRILGPLDVDRFRSAFARTVAATDALRTVVGLADGVPEQRVLRELEFELPFESLSSEGDLDAALRERVDRMLARPMAMSERLFDSALFALADDRFAWFLSQHHIITDGASMALVFERVSDAYVALGEGTESVERYASYLDYVERERELRESTVYQRAERYRVKKLAREIPAVRFYRDEVPARSRVERRRIVRLDRETTERLERAATSEGMPTERAEQALFLLFAGLLASYVHRASGHRDIGLGMVFHNRLTEVDRRTAGLYVNLFPLHFEVGEGETFLDMMRKAMTESFAAVRYGPYCISNPGRKRSYDILFNYLPMTYPRFAGRPVEIEWAHTGASDGNHSLSLHVHDFEGSGRLSLVFDFNTGVFDEPEQERAIADFLELVDRFAADPRGLVGAPTAAPSAPERPLRARETDPDAPASISEYEAPLAAIWCDLLGVESVDPRDDFFDLGGHSLLAVSLVSRIEESLGQRVPLTALFAHPTVRGLAAAIEGGVPEGACSARSSAEAEGAEDLLIVVRAPDRVAAGPAFFCVPGAGGYAFRYRNLAGHLDGRAVYGFRPLVETTVEAIASEYCRAMRGAQPAGPYHLGGTCLGAVIAFEMAQQLRAAGEEVASLVLINVQGELDYRVYRWLGGKLDRIYRAVGAAPPVRRDRLIDLIRVGKAARRTLRREKVRLLRPFSQSAREAWRRDWASLGKVHAEHRAVGVAQTRAALAYRPRPYDGRVHLFLAKGIRARSLYDERAAWRALAAGGLEVEIFEGDHETVLEEPRVGAVGRAVEAVIAAST